MNEYIKNAVLVGGAVLVTWLLTNYTDRFDAGADAEIRDVVKEEIASLSEDVDELKQGQSRMDGKLDGMLEALQNYARSD